MKLIGLVIVVLGLICPILGFLMKVKIRPLSVPHLEFIPMSNETKTFASPASICRAGIDTGNFNWNIWELAAIPVIADFINDSLKDYWISESGQTVPYERAVINSGSPAAVVFRYLLASKRMGGNQTTAELEYFLHQLDATTRGPDSRSKMFEDEVEITCLNFEEQCDYGDFGGFDTAEECYESFRYDCDSGGCDGFFKDKRCEYQGNCEKYDELCTRSCYRFFDWCEYYGQCDDFSATCGDAYRCLFLDKLWRMCTESCDTEDCADNCTSFYDELEDSDECRAVNLLSLGRVDPGSPIMVGVSDLLPIYGWGFRREPLGYGVLIDNAYTYWFQVGIDAVVPFFPVVYDLFLGSFFTSLTQNMLGFVFGSNRMSLRFALTMNLNAEIEDAFNIDSLEEFYHDEFNLSIAPPMIANLTRPMLIGHGGPGLVAKALALNHSWYGLALESTQYSRSPIDAFFPSTDGRAEYGLFNLYSGNSLLTMPEPEAKMNYELPTWQSILNTADSYETMCLLMAGCVRDARFDQLCGQLVGRDQYRRYFESWGRPRFGDQDDEIQPHSPAR
jgi:hypothetical protein